MNIFTKEYVESVPKIINVNGCWIPYQKPTQNGYVLLTIDKEHYYLHRIVMCVYNNIDYDNKKVISRHGKNCIKVCFNPEHIKSGSDSDNANDGVEFGTNFNISKRECPKCGGAYKIKMHKNGRDKGKQYRYCPVCANNWNRSQWPINNK